jgi:hypothetical protein
MQQILMYFWQMCLLKRGPEQLPGDWFPLGLTFAAYFLVALLSLLIGRGETTPIFVLGSIVIGVAIQTLIVASVLAFKRVGHRFPATMAALFGTNTVILVIMLPVTVLLDIEETAIRPFAEALYLASFVWWLTIAGFVLHRGAGISLLQGIAIAFGSEMIVLSTTLTIFPNTG